MNFYGRANEAAAEILKAFEHPQNLPEPLAAIIIHKGDNSPCRKWSLRNQLLMALHGHLDARGFRQWEAVGRHVKLGERSFHILAPVTRSWRNEDTGEKKVVVLGFKSIAVFGLAQTEGQPLPENDHDTENFIQSLPLLDVARQWGLDVNAVDGEGLPFLGKYKRGKEIQLGVKNLTTWTHELCHASDHRLGTLTEFGQHWRGEVVAELGAATLLRILGYEVDTDLGGVWSYISRYSAAAGIEPLEACGRVLSRTVAVVTQIMDASEALKKRIFDVIEWDWVAPAVSPVAAV